MANTYTQIFIHAVFAVQGRQNLIQAGFQDEVQKYMTGIVTNLGSKLIAINNRPDHFHLLIGYKPHIALSELIGKVKSGASGLINQKKWIQGRFEWQEGFGGFSYSTSQLDTVVRYIQNQEQHHTRKSFREEYLELLNEFGIPYDEKYLFRWIE